MYLIVGLGNPEEEYSNTRHNMGFDVINELSKKFNINVTKTKFKGIYGLGTINDVPEEDGIVYIKNLEKTNNLLNKFVECKVKDVSEYDLIASLK